MVVIERQNRRTNKCVYKAIGFGFLWMNESKNICILGKSGGGGGFLFWLELN